MIIESIYIENYKQFVGLHSFTPPKSGIVAIIGNNGAGKTTLFEAIEWCLYQPREIRADEITPRGHDDAVPRVTVALSDPESGRKFVVQRILKRSGATAVVSEFAGDIETILATGAPAVTAYCANELIGLEHKAFVSTFFTRQKELSFFGALKPTERRREVGRLLGLETIRTAQESIAADRAKQKQRAEIVRVQYDAAFADLITDDQRAELDHSLAECESSKQMAEFQIGQCEHMVAILENNRDLLVEDRQRRVEIQAEIDREQHAITLANGAWNNALVDRSRRQEVMVIPKNELARLEEQLLGLDALTIDDQIAELRPRHTKMLEEQATNKANVAALGSQLSELELFLNREVADLGICPVCGRPATEEDAATSVAHASAKYEELRDQQIKFQAANADLKTRIAGTLDGLVLAERTKQTVDDLKQRIANGQSWIATAVTALADSEKRVSESKHDLDVVTKQRQAAIKIHQVGLRALGDFDQAKLDGAAAALLIKRQEIRTLQSQRDDAISAINRIEREIERSEADDQRVLALSLLATEARSESDLLDGLYREFSGFEQYVTRRVRPNIERMASDLVSTITDGKYTSVSLDDDYGIRVSDGSLGDFPIEQFSGGERDVIALSARLALSRLIGSQATHPPQFLVLDEVFGALDSDRRANVIELLASLTGATGPFRQLFVISHVDDVKMAPSFDQIWQVSETAEGSSQLDSLESLGVDGNV